MPDTPKLDLILTCTGRTASGFYARYLSSAGLQCGHEKIFNPHGYDHAIRRLGKFRNLVADSAWEAAPWLDSEPLKDAFVVHLIRHPKPTIESWMRFATESAPIYWDYAARWCPRMGELEYPIDRYAHRYEAWNRLIEEKCANRPSVRFDVAREPRELLEILQERGLLETIRPEGALFSNRRHNKHGSAEMRFHLDLIHDPQIRADLEQIAADYGYQWPAQPATIVTPVVKAVITTLDNADLLQRQIDVLDKEPIDEIVIVNNGSTDGTRDWLDALSDQYGSSTAHYGTGDPTFSGYPSRSGSKYTVIHRENHGAGPGRNAGLNAARRFDYVLMLDGGVLPARGSIDKMRTYLDPRPGISGLGVEVQDLRTDESAAWFRWTEEISRTYVNKCLSHTAYGLFRWDAWDGFRFTEDGPFSEPGWGADDNEMRYQWLDARKVIRVVTCGCRLPYFHGQCIGGSVHAYRRQAGSWARLKRETGLEPWGEGSVYEKRCVWLQHHWPRYDLGEQRDEPWMTVIVKAASTIEDTAAMIREAHAILYKRKLIEPGNRRLPHPYSVLLWLNDAPPSVIAWAEQRHLRRHYGSTITVDGEIVRRTEQNEDEWTGDFRLSYADQWHEDVRPEGYFFGYADTVESVQRLARGYQKLFPRQHRRAQATRLKDRPRPRRRATEIRIE